MNCRWIIVCARGTCNSMAITIYTTNRRCAHTVTTTVHHMYAWTQSKFISTDLRATAYHKQYEYDDFFVSNTKRHIENGEYRTSIAFGIEQFLLLCIMLDHISHSHYLCIAQHTYYVRPYDEWMETRRDRTREKEKKKERKWNKFRIYYFRCATRDGTIRTNPHRYIIVQVPKYIYNFRPESVSLHLDWFVYEIIGRLISLVFGFLCVEWMNGSPFPINSNQILYIRLACMSPWMDSYWKIYCNWSVDSELNNVFNHRICLRNIGLV